MKLPAILKRACPNMLSHVRQGCHIKKRVQYGNLDIRACFYMPKIF